MDEPAATPGADTPATAAMVSQLATMIEANGVRQAEVTRLQAELTASEAENARLRALLVLNGLENINPDAIDRLAILADKLNNLPDYGADLETLLVNIESLVHDLFNHTRGLREVDRLVQDVNVRLGDYVNLSERMKALLRQIEQACTHLETDVYGAMQHVRTASRESAESAEALMAAVTVIGTAAQAANSLTVMCNYLVEAISRRSTFS